MDSGRGLFRDALDIFGHIVPEPRIPFELTRENGINNCQFLVIRGLIENGSVFFRLISPMDKEGGIAAIVHDDTRTWRIRKTECLQGAFPVFFQGLALPGKDRGTTVRDSRRGMVLR